MIAEIASDETTNGFLKKGRGTRPKCVKMLTEAKELQELLGKAAKGKGLKPIEQSALARVWKELGEFRLRLQGKGPPKAVDMSDRKRKTKGQAQGFTEAPGEGAKATRPAKQIEPKP